jgi:hypothetical protein
MAFLGQFLASLAAILVLAWLARRLGLGRDIRIRDEQHARLLADEVICGFEAQEIALDRSGSAALLRDQAGRVILVKVHGAQFAGRLLGRGSSAAIWEDFGKSSLEADSGERLFGKALLDVDDPEDWVNAINSAKAGSHA